MNKSLTTALARIWADAAPLYRFIEERAEQQCRQITPARGPTRARQLSTVELASRNLQLHMNLAAARDKARTATINDLIAARIVGLGRPSDFNVFERVDDSFWIGAAVDWVDGTASRDGKTVIDIRVVPADALLPLQPAVQDAPGRPSKEDVIRAAIAAYAKEDPTLARAPSERIRGYCNYISSHGYNPRNDPGFSDKTFQKYERKFRLENK